MITLTRTGRKVEFKSVHIGQPFVAHDRFWVRFTASAATELHGSLTFGSCCDFTIEDEDRFVEEVVLRPVAEYSA